VKLSKYAVTETNEIGQGVTIGEFAVVRAGARLGNDVVIHPHVVIESGVEIGPGTEVFPGAYLGKAPRGAGALARSPSFERRLVIGANCSIGPHAVIFFDVEIGDNTLLGDGASVREQGRIGSRCILSRYVTLNYDVRVGDGTKIMDNTHITGKTRIGNGVFISVNVSTVNDNALGRHGFQDEAIRGPLIEDGAMVGANAVLLPGVVVGRGAVVGSGAVVSRDVEPGTVVVGMPARCVRRVEAA
jgi:acetyltransferase-like isoleucine patch superfamily enzyme